MSEHRIRFRGGWESSTIEGGLDVAQRLSLPVDWPSGVVGTVRLIRRFGCPPIDRFGSVRLEFRAVPGLRAVQLNGDDIGRPPADVFDWSVPLARLLAARNVLMLDVDLASVSPADFPGGWGSIALVIVPGPGPGD
jgi:hypothetical protein